MSIWDGRANLVRPGTTACGPNDHQAQTKWGPLAARKPGIFFETEAQIKKKKTGNMRTAKRPDADETLDTLTPSCSLSHMTTWR